MPKNLTTDGRLSEQGVTPVPIGLSGEKVHVRVLCEVHQDIRYRQSRERHARILSIDGQRPISLRIRRTPSQVSMVPYRKQYKNYNGSCTKKSVLF